MPPTLPKGLWAFHPPTPQAICMLLKNAYLACTTTTMPRNLWNCLRKMEYVIIPIALVPRALVTTWFSPWSEKAAVLKLGSPDDLGLQISEILASTVHSFSPRTFENPKFENHCNKGNAYFCIYVVFIGDHTAYLFLCLFLFSPFLSFFFLSLSVMAWGSIKLIQINGWTRGTVLFVRNK